MNIKKLGIATASAAALALVSPAALAAWTLNMTPGITAISRRVFELHMLMFWWCVAIGFFVFGWMIYSMFAFRKSRGATPDAQLTHNTKAEVIWTVIPVLILIGMAVPATRALIETEDATNTAADDPHYRIPVEVGLSIHRLGRRAVLDARSGQQCGAPAGLRH